MKRIALCLLPLAFASLLHAAPVVVVAPVDHLFVPSGFDNNDNVEVMVTGKFPSTCFSRNKVDVKVQNETIYVNVTALYAQEVPNAFTCEKIGVPFKENITIGNLQAGKYNIIVNRVLKEELEVAVSNSRSVDDHLYAMVDYVELGFTGGLSGDAFLVGKNVDCLKLDKVEYRSNGKDTLSILPIMKKVTSSCSTKKEYFETPIKFIPKAFKKGKIMLFVRTMDGKSVTNFVDQE